MTTAEKKALLDAFSVAAKIVENTPTEENTFSSEITPPMIGPMFDNVGIADKLTALPFSNEEFTKAVEAMQDAIKNQNRMAGGVDALTHVLSGVRQLLPMLLAL